MPSIAQYRELGRPFLGHLFRVVFDRIPVGRGDNDRRLHLKIMTTTLPGKTITPVELQYGQGRVLRYAGVAEYESTWTTEFKENENLGAMDTIMAWMDFAYDTRTGIGSDKEAYAVDAQVQTLKMNDPNGEPEKTRHLLGVWPSSCDAISLDGASPDSPPLSVTWTFDYWEDDDERGIGGTPDNI